MKKILAATISAASLVSFAAAAQVTTDTTTQTYTAPAMAPVSPALVPPAQPAAPPVGTLSTTRETHAVDAYGNRMDSQASTYRNSQGVAEDRVTRTIVNAPPPPVTTTTSTSTSTTTQPQ